MTALIAAVPILLVIVLMIAFNKRCGSILEVNAMLASHKLPTLKTSGSLE